MHVAFFAEVARFEEVGEEGVGYVADLPYLSVCVEFCAIEDVCAIESSFFSEDATAAFFGHVGTWVVRGGVLDFVSDLEGDGLVDAVFGVCPGVDAEGDEDVFEGA